MERPNILLIMTDQQRYDSLGCYGAEFAHTPNLDRLASEGVLFERCYVNNPICTPSRASMFTGKHLPGHRVYKLYDILPEDEVMFTEHLWTAGYQTALFGKLHVSSAFGYEDRTRNPHDGFEIYEWCHEPALFLDAPHNAYGRWLEEIDPEFYAEFLEKGRGLLHVPRERHMNYWAAERTIDFIDNHDAERPFFAMMSVFDPHNPYEDHPTEMADLVDESAIPDPEPRDVSNLPRGVRQEHEHNYLGRFKDMSREELRKMRHGYHASVAHIDLEVGRVLEALEKSGQADNTLVIFTSDHGDMLGDHSLMVKGGFFYDPNVRVPLIMRWPERFGSGQRIQTNVQPHDLAATVMSAAGIAPDLVAQAAPDAADMGPVAAGEAERVRDHAVTIFRNTGRAKVGSFNPPNHCTMFRDERYKLNVFHTSLDGNGEPEGELYDMVEDPGERNNLWDDPGHAMVRARLTGRLVDFLVDQDLRHGRHAKEFLRDAPTAPVPNPARRYVRGT